MNFILFVIHFVVEVVEHKCCGIFQELVGEIGELEKQRDELEAELKKVLFCSTWYVVTSEARKITFMWWTRPQYCSIDNNSANVSSILKITLSKLSVLYPRICVWTHTRKGELPMSVQPILRFTTWPTRSLNYSLKGLHIAEHLL